MVPVGGVGETGLCVWQAGEIEGHGQGGHGDVDLGEGPDATLSEEGFRAQVRAVGEVEDCVGLGRVHGEVEGALTEGGLPALARRAGETTLQGLEACFWWRLLQRLDSSESYARLGFRGRGLFGRIG